MWQHKKDWTEDKKSKILGKHGTVKTYYDFLVPDQVPEKEFWERYCYRCNKDRIVKKIELLPPAEIEERIEKMMSETTNEKAKEESPSQSVYDRSKLRKFTIAKPRFVEEELTMEEPKIKLKKVSTADTSPKKLGSPSRLAYDRSKLKKAAQTVTTEDAAEPKSTTTDAYTSALKNMRKIIVVPSLEQASSEEPNPYASVLKNKEKSSLSWEDGPPISTEEAVEMIQVREDDTSHPDEFLTSSSTVLSPSTGLKSLRDNLQFDESAERDAAARSQEWLGSPQSAMRRSSPSNEDSVPTPPQSTAELEAEPDSNDHSLKAGLKRAALKKAALEKSSVDPTKNEESIPKPPQNTTRLEVEPATEKRAPCAEDLGTTSPRVAPKDYLETEPDPNDHSLKAGLKRAALKNAALKKSSVNKQGEDLVLSQPQQPMEVDGPESNPASDLGPASGESQPTQVVEITHRESDPQGVGSIAPEPPTEHASDR